MTDADRASQESMVRRVQDDWRIPQAAADMTGRVELTSARIADGWPLVLKGVANVSEDINVLALVKGTERYIFLFDDANRARTLRVLGRYASSPDLSFTWYDAAILSQKIRRPVDDGPATNRLFLTQPTDRGDDELA